MAHRVGGEHAAKGEWDLAARHFALAGAWEPKQPRLHVQAWTNLAGGNVAEYRRLCQQLLNRFEAQQTTHHIPLTVTAAVGECVGANATWQRVATLACLHQELSTQATFADLVAYTAVLNQDNGIAAKRLTELAHRATAHFPQSSACLETLGGACYRSGNFADAEKYLSRAVQLDGRGGTAWMDFFLAMTHQRLGNAKKAKDFFDQARLPKNPNWSQQLIYDQLRREAIGVLGLQKK